MEIISSNNGLSFGIQWMFLISFDIGYVHGMGIVAWINNKNFLLIGQRVTAVVVWDFLYLFIESHKQRPLSILHVDAGRSFKNTNIILFIFAYNCLIIPCCLAYRACVP